eukprot:91781_1
MKLTWFAPNVFVVALTFQFLVRSVTLSDLPNDATPIQWRCSCGFPFNLISVPICNFCESKQSELTLEDIVESSDTDLPNDATPIQWRCSCGFPFNLISVPICNFCESKQSELTLEDIVESSDTGSGDYTDDIISTEKGKTESLLDSAFVWTVSILFLFVASA